MDENQEEMQTFAGHLLAEMFVARDQLRRKKITKETYKARIAVLRRRARSGDHGLLRTMEEIQRTFSGVMVQAEELRV